MDIQSSYGHLSKLTPTRLSKKEHHWVFAVYSEYPRFRDDGRQYTAFIFRNDERTVFGLKEYYDFQHVDYRKMATKVIQGKEYRESLISNDSDLPKIWKKH